jgi:carbon-monoxide dehydrogenase large subunit
MEPRARHRQLLDRQTERYTLIAPTQGVAIVRKVLAENVFKVPAEKIRVLTHDVGGGFGMKTQAYSEYAALLCAARRTGRPVRWCATRLESFLTDTAARDGLLEGELALDADGYFLALRARTFVGIGAYATNYVAIITTRNTSNCLSSVYAIPAIHFASRWYSPTLRRWDISRRRSAESDLSGRAPDRRRRGRWASIAWR